MYTIFPVGLAYHGSSSERMGENEMGRFTCGILFVRKISNWVKRRMAEFE